MRRSFSHRFAKNESAAIAPMYALGIGTLIVMSAVGFDYGRLMALDTELQNAADQAALAAATQLDGGADAMTRARDAATSRFANAASQFVNQTRFANDGAGRPITNLTFEFFDGYANDTLGDTVALNATDGADAKVVQVTVNARRVFYALTPLVGAFTSGDVIGRALAGLETATCNVPPMMFCVPNLPAGGADTAFPRDSDIGRGLHLHMNANAADPWAPGNFGFLNIDYGITGNPNHTLGLNEGFLGCTGDVIESETGVRDPQSDALNARFDMYNNSVGNNSCDSDGNFCPAENVRRNWVNIQSRNNVQPADLASESCSSTESNNWVLIDNLPTTATAPDLLVRPPSQQFPKDDCLISNSCGAVLGDGVWDGNAYMALHHPGVALSTAAPNGTRFEVYKWEIADKAARLVSPQKVGYFADERPNGRYNVELYCSFPQPAIGTAVPATNTQKDRRLLTVAAVDCTGLNGSAPVNILRWVDLFLAQPADVIGSDKSFFTEIAGPASKPNGDSGFQYFGRKKAVLIR